MYEAYYGFAEKPFALSPDPKYLFLSATHREVLGHLLYGIEQGEGFMAISGEVGTGKTTLCRTLLDRLGGSCEIAFLFNPTLSPIELIKAINREFALSTFGESRPELLDVLNTFLLDQNAQGRRVLVIIDEAQNLPRETLEQLRLLSNLESHTAKLLQIVLIGQPELDQTLETRELRQLRQRISVWWRLGPLAAAETREYVRHRLRVAGGHRPIFTDAALAAVHRRSGGVPRLVNVLCDRALLAGFGEQTLEITPRIIRAVARELRLDRAAPRRRAWRIGVGAAGAAALATLAWAGLSGWRPIAVDRSEPPPVAAPAPATAAAPAVAMPPPTPVVAAPVEPPGPTPLVDDVLDNLLALQSAPASNARALSVMLAAWDLPAEVPLDLDFPRLLAALEERGLRVLQVASSQELASLDVPGLIRLRGRDGELRTAVLRHIEAEDAELEALLPGKPVRVSAAALDTRWAGSGYAVWRNFEGLPPLLRSGDSGAGVAFVQRALAQLGHYAGEDHGSFDAETSRAVLAFQADAGLAADGAVGPVTQVRLYHALPEYRMPILAFRDIARAAP